MVSADPRKNTLTVKTDAGEHVAYDPSQLRVQTARSSVYRKDTRELAIGDRIQLTHLDREQRIRSGDFATIEQIRQNNSISARLDNGKTIRLTSERAQHLEYGYAADAGQRISADRVLITGDGLGSKAFTGISPTAQYVAIYTSDSSVLQRQQSNARVNEVVPKPVAPPQEYDHGYGLGLGL